MAVTYLRDPDAAILQKLATLILAARPEVSDELVRMIEIISRALGLPRQAGEGDVDYALRLAEGLKVATPGQRAAVEKLLGQLAPGFDPLLLADALKNPAGPAAARLVALLEASRFGFRELAVRTAITSYGQVAGPQPASAPAPAPSKPATQRVPQGPVVTAQSASPRSFQPLPVSMSGSAEIRESLAGTASTPPAVHRDALQTSIDKPAVQPRPGSALGATSPDAEPRPRNIRTFQTDAPPISKLVKLTLAMSAEGLKSLGGARITTLPADAQPAGSRIRSQSASRSSVGQRPVPQAIGNGHRDVASPEGRSFIVKTFGHGPGAAVQQAAETLKGVIVQAQLAAIRSMKPQPPAQSPGQELSLPQAVPELAAHRGALAGRRSTLPSTLQSPEEVESSTKASTAKSGSGAIHEVPGNPDTATVKDMRITLRDGIPFYPVNYQPVREVAAIGEPEELSREHPSDREDDQQEAREDPDEQTTEAEEAPAGDQAAQTMRDPEDDFDDAFLDFGYGLYRLNQG